MSDVALGSIHPSRPHLFADAIEIQVLFGSEGPFSKADAFSLINQTPPSEEDVIPDMEDDLDDDDQEDDLSTAEISSNKQGKINAAFAQFEYRRKAFGDTYPFEIDTNQNLIVTDQNNEGQIAYAFLLCCSRLRSFGSRAAQNKLAMHFETLCADSMKGFLPAHAEIIQFGVGAAQRQALGTDMRVAIPKLANKLGVALDPRWSETDETAQGDGGLDIVGCVALDEGVSKMSEKWTIVGQCASHERSSSWESKISEAQRGLMKRLSFQHRPSNALFIPSAYRKTDGTWPNATIDKDALLMDRVRILHNIADLGAADTLCWEWLNNAAGRSIDLDLLNNLRS